MGQNNTNSNVMCSKNDLYNVKLIDLVNITKSICRLIYHQFLLKKYKQ